MEVWRSRVGYPGTALLGLLLIFSFVSNQSPPTKTAALGTNLSTGGVVSPTIDGVIGTDEWAFASRIDFTASLYSGTIYIMNDDAQMYIAVRLTRNGGAVPLQVLTVQITFDNTKAGTYHSGMDEIAYDGTNDPHGLDGNLISVGGVCCYGYQDTSLGGTNDVVTAATSNRAFDFVEFQHPLCSGDPNDFCLYPGKSVGFSIFIVYQGGDTGEWQSGGPAYWAHYHVGWNSCFHEWGSAGLSSEASILLELISCHRTRPHPNI